MLMSKYPTKQCTKLYRLIEGMQIGKKHVPVGSYYLQ